MDALEVLAHILGAGTTGRFYRSLVVDQGVAVGAGAWYNGDNRGPGLIAFSVSPADGVDLDRAETALRAEIARILEHGVTEKEVARTKFRLKDAAAMALDSLRGPANTIGRLMMIGMSLEEIESWPERIDKVSVEDVNAAARSVLSTPGEVMNRLLPEQGPDATP